METIGADAYNHEYLFHGSKTAEPEKIYKSSEGFNIKFSNVGAYGKGIYFASEAIYSDNGYAYNHGNGVMGMFLANVLLGKIIKADNRELRLGYYNNDINEPHSSIEAKIKIPAYMI